MEKKESNPLYKSAVDVWYSFYRYKIGEEYVFDKKDGFHLKQLLSKIETKLKQKGMDTGPEMVINSLKGFLAALNDQWILDHLEISIVNSKFNVAYSRAVKSSPFTASSRIDDLINKRHSPGAGQQDSSSKATG